MPMTAYLTPLTVTVLPTAYFFVFAYAASTTTTLAFVSVVRKLRPLVIFDEVSGPRAGFVTSVP